MSHLIVLVGNIGTGKSTYRKGHFNSDEVVVCPDEWNIQCADEIERRIKRLIKEGLSTGKTVVFDGNSITKSARRILLYLTRGLTSKTTIIDFGKGNAYSLQRRISNSPECPASFWEEKHLSFQKDYEPPEESEGFEEIIRIYDE